MKIILESYNEKHELKSKGGKSTTSGRFAALTSSSSSSSPPSSPKKNNKPDSPSRNSKKSRVRCRGESNSQSSSSHSKRNNHSSRTNNNNSNSNSNNSLISATGAKHDMPMGKKDLYFALDCEMVGIGPDGVDSALARVSIVNWDHEVVLDTFVKVPVPVTDYRTFVSGVRSEDIESKGAKELTEVREIVQDILRGKILIGHGLENDLRALMMTHPWCDTRDTATYAPYMREIVIDKQQETADPTANSTIRVPRRLKDLAWEQLNSRIQNLGVAHSPIEDAMAALNLYKKARPDWEKRICRQVKKANDLQIASQQQQQQQQQQHISKSIRLLSIHNNKRRVQVAPMSMYGGQVAPQSMNTTSLRQQHQYANSSMYGHNHLPVLPDPRNIVYMADGRPLYYVPQLNNYQNKSFAQHSQHMSTTTHEQPLQQQRDDYNMYHRVPAIHTKS